jgi:hypothetical protein
MAPEFQAAAGGLFHVKGRIMPTLVYLLARLREPSSYAGLGALLAMVGLHFSDSVLGQLAQFLAAGCGLAALLLKERGLIQMIALAAILGTTLGACGTTSSTTSATVQAGAQVVLTATEQAMCAAQSAANLASAVALAAGDTNAATDASKASTAAGVGCTWATPVPAVTSAAANS